MSKVFNIKQIKDPAIWDRFNKKQPYSLFVQSPAYVDFYTMTGERGLIYGIYHKGTLIGGSVCVSVRARRGSFLFLPYGPVIDDKYKQYTEQVFDKLFTILKKKAKKYDLSFIRVSPFIKNSPQMRKMFSSMGFRRAPLHILAEHTWMIDVQKDEKELLLGMKKNHRNLVRRCIKKGVIIKKNNTTEGLKNLDTLLDITAKRHNFTRFSFDYIQKEFDAFHKRGEADIYEAYLPTGELDSVAIIMRHGTMSAYRHSASLNINRKLPTSYLLQWQAIKDAKKEGMKYYNFWGIAPKGASKKHPFYGITHFKKNFGGFGLELVPCIDMPISSKYIVNWLIETMRRLKRGF